MHTFSNTVDGVTARIYRHINGFSVVVKDDDSGEVIGAVICPNEDVAIGKSKQLIGG